MSLALRMSGVMLVMVWFQMTRGLVQVTIASTDLKDEALAAVEEAFIGAGLL